LTHFARRSGDSEKSEDDLQHVVN